MTPRRKAQFGLAMAAPAAAALLLLACASGGGKLSTSTPSTLAPGGTPSSNETPATSAEDALARYVERLNQGFIADCDKAKRPDDVGKQCARKIGQRGDLQAYALGPTFSDATRILIIRPEGNDWTLVTIKNLDPDQPQAPGVPWPLAAGADVVVAGTAPDCLKVREAAGISSAELDCLKDGTAATIIAGPVQRDNIEWWQLQDRGWAAGDYLRYADAAPAATATPR